MLFHSDCVYAKRMIQYLYNKKRGFNHIDIKIDSIDRQIESVAMGLNKVDLKVSALDKKKLRRTY